MKNIVDIVSEHKIIVVARGLKDDEVIPFCEAIYKGGVRLVEVPFNQLSANRLTETPKQIAMIKEAFGDKFSVGAGTVLSVEEVDAAVDAGATYILSPSLDEAVVRRAKERGIGALPGVMTPTEAQNAHLYGADMVKMFPMGSLGIPYLKAVRVPLSHLKMIAMGGVDETNICDYLKVCEAVGIGNGICNRALIDKGDYEEITRRALAFTSQI